MEDIYEVIVNDCLFEKIDLKKCERYCFINDRKRMQYKKGNILTFKNNEKTLKAEILNMFYFDTIKDVFDMMGKEKLGFSANQNLDKIEDYYYTNYKASDIDKFGLVVVEFKVL